MKYVFWLLILLSLGWANSALGQTVNFEDGFEDGDFTNNPVWNGDTGDFTVVDDNPNFLLQLDAAGASPSYLSTSSSTVEGVWEFYLEFRGFEPSGSNQAEVFLMSDIADLEGAVNGYAVQVGESGDDFFKIVRYDNGTEAATVLTGTTVVQSGGTYTVRVNREANGNWQMEVSSNYGGPFDTNISGTDNTYSSASYFGPRINFTSTRSDKFFLDFKIDLPPFDISQTSISGSQVDLTFNREYNQSTVQTSDFSIDNGIGSPSTVTFPNATTVRLDYGSTNFPSNEYTVTVNNVDDQNGETIATDTQNSFVIFDTYSQGDIIINEFVYDYPPLLSEEYIEIKNTSSKYLNLADWHIADNNSSSDLGSDPIPIEPDGFLVISADTTELHNLFGDRAYHKASFPALNNTTRDAVQLITDNGAKADSLTYNSDWGGTDVALERRSTSTPSIYRENWGDSPNPNSGTPGTANEVSEDNTPPKLTGLNILSTQTLQVVFDERLNLSGNYSITNSSISSIDQTDGDTVELSLGSPLQDAQSYTLSIDGTEDIFGNTIAPTDTSFTFYNPSPVDSGDVAINEFMYAPPSGNTEYIELYNHSNKSLDLQNWTLSDNREGFEAAISNSQFIIPPDSFVVIAPDNTLQSAFPDIALVTMSDFPALNNGGDQIIIRNHNGTLLDSLQYNSDWGGDEIGLERRTTDIAGTFRENWGDSPNPNSGTPGFANEVSTDQTPPFFEELYAVDATTLQLVFSEKISPTDKQNYQISPGRNIQMVVAKNDSVQLLLDEPMVSEKTYEVTASNISDIFGNTLSAANKEITFLQIDEAQPRDIVINEVMYSPGSNEADFIELYNTSSKNIDLSNWKIGDAVGDATIPGNMQLLASGYLVLTESDIFASTVPNAIDVSGFPALNSNTPDAVYLKNEDGQTIDSLRYSQTWGGNEDGTSLERKDPRAASNDASNWQTNSTNKGHSAGSENAAFNEDSNPPKIIFSKTLANGNIEVRFNEFIQLTGDVKFLMNGQELMVANFDSANANVITLTTSASKSPVSNSITITVQNLSDIRGNVTSSSEVAVAQPLRTTEIVINEIMFNPLNDPDDNKADQGEYIELRNTQNHAVSLEGLYLHDAPDEDGEVRDLEPVLTTAKWVPAQGKVLIHADPAETFTESKVANFFDIASPEQRSVMRVDRSSLSLSSSDDAIFISDSSGTTIDSVFYDESWHNPNIIDNRGIALERVSPDGPSNDETNWGSSVNAKGGTPNKENSLYQESAESREGNGISFNPNPFSPDDDGFEDNLFINYKLDQQDYLIKVHIYDRYGRLVRELADGKQAGFEGQLIWDGRKDNGSRNRIGIYIIVFEAYDSTSGADKSFKKTVVLARKLN